MTTDRKTPLTILLCSLASLAFEVSLTRIFSIFLSYHFAFMIISIAMLGLAASGAALAIFPCLKRVELLSIYSLLLLSLPPLLAACLSGSPRLRVTALAWAATSILSVSGQWDFSGGGYATAGFAGLGRSWLQGRTWQFFLEVEGIVPALFVQVAILSLLLLAGKDLRRGEGRGRWLLPYFGLLGCGFMFVETARRDRYAKARGGAVTKSSFVFFALPVRAPLPG